ncbi:hypothetical protein ASPZODRAFT_130032 [Penicilliopsis zonata CBS 506.65]|uniref:Uncharacterized protein n=1 Tax=Penicilliopsis zonata CBS 506.65 TaxID=1073090 RepID=A0A1L9SLF9_9EURO|nr:hypothetical protein ASPZODRAFT_130032 [Penicilliopsis zonata CBS 506.65]OJJ48102.1 hypothetical protein ASPZODRAFT_130032 [Penicilliopsis zonata CBS 506.65]
MRPPTSHHPFLRPSRLHPPLPSFFSSSVPFFFPIPPPDTLFILPTPSIVLCHPHLEPAPTRSSPLPELKKSQTRRPLSPSEVLARRTPSPRSRPVARSPSLTLDSQLIQQLYNT